MFVEVQGVKGAGCAGGTSFKISDEKQNQSHSDKLRKRDHQNNIGALRRVLAKVKAVVQEVQAPCTPCTSASITSGAGRCGRWQAHLRHMNLLAVER